MSFIPSCMVFLLAEKLLKYQRLILDLAKHGGAYHHQPIYVPTAGAQAFLMDYT
jgi:hypothetical protein